MEQVGLKAHSPQVLDPTRPPSFHWGKLFLLTVSKEDELSHCEQEAQLQAGSFQFIRKFLLPVSCLKTHEQRHFDANKEKVRGRKKPININNFAGLSRRWVGVKLFMCFPFSWGKRETHKQNSQEISGKGRDSPGIIPGQSRENFVYVFSCLLVFPGPKK